MPIGAAHRAGMPSSAQRANTLRRISRTKKSKPSTNRSTPSRKASMLLSSMPWSKRRIWSSGLIARAISASTSAFGRPIVAMMAPTWRLKLTRSKRSKSAMLKAPMPKRARVSRWTPPTPPMPAIATRLPRSACCSHSVTQPMLRSNARSYENRGIYSSRCGHAGRRPKVASSTSRCLHGHEIFRRSRGNRSFAARQVARLRWQSVEIDPTLNCRGCTRCRPVQTCSTLSPISFPRTSRTTR